MTDLLSLHSFGPAINGFDPHLNDALRSFHARRRVWRVVCFSVTLLLWDRVIFGYNWNQFTEKGGLVLGVRNSPLCGLVGLGDSLPFII